MTSLIGSNIFSEFKFCTNLFKLVRQKGKIPEQDLINVAAEAIHVVISKRKAREMTMCAELLLKKQPTVNTFTIIKNLVRQQNFAVAFSNQCVSLVLLKYIKHEEIRSALWFLSLNGGLIARIQAVAYVVQFAIDYDDRDTMSLMDILDRTVVENFDAFLAMIDFGNIQILRGVLLLTSVFSRKTCLQNLLCSSSIRLRYALEIKEMTYKLIIESALFSIVTPSSLPIIDIYINATLPNLTFKNEGDFTIKCKDEDVKCHRLILESAETDHFRSNWLKDSQEYEEKETEAIVVKEMLHYLYTGDCNTSLELCYYADKIRMQHLCDFCAITIAMKLDDETFPLLYTMITDCFITPSKKAGLQQVLAHYYACNYSRIEEAGKYLDRLVHWIGSLIVSHVYL